MPSPTNGEIEVGGVNKDGTAVGVVNWGDGEGAFLITADGKGMVLSKTDLDNPAGGTFGNGINNKVSINDAGNVAFTVTNDRGDGAVDETFFVDRATDPAKPKWVSVARAGMSVTGGKINNTVSFATINNANDVVFTAALDSGTGTYISTLP
jgi:hypothetical protein